MRSKKLYKKKHGSMFFGVLNGICEYIGIDTIILRFIFILSCLIFYGIPSIMLYIILAFIIPGEEKIGYSNYDIN